MDMDNVTIEQEPMLPLELVKSRHTKHEQKKRHKDKSQILREGLLYESFVRLPRDLGSCLQPGP